LHPIAEAHDGDVLDPRERHWSRLLDGLPQHLGRITVWRAGPEPAGDGHQHHIPTLVACLEGAVRIVRPDERLDLGAGDVLVVAPGVWHRHVPPRAGSVAFGLGFFGTISDVVFIDHDGLRTGGIPAQPARLLMERALAAADARAAVATVIDQVLAEHIQPLARFDHPAMGAMLAAMWGGLHRGVGADDLVRASGLGRSRAFQVFTDAYGMPPQRALEDARLGLAGGLLAAGVAVGETARRCGFADRRAFTRAWKRRHGTPPRRHPART
jgi:AraC-like DNA-binding protein/quercetin dioxygenase-like cupin family protein